MVTDSVALLMSSPESCEQNLGGNTLVVPIDARGNARLCALRKYAFGAY